MGLGGGLYSYNAFVTNDHNDFYGDLGDNGSGVLGSNEIRGDYTDASVILPFGTKIHSINGSLKDLSTTSPVAAQLGLEGRISDTGYFKADGTMGIAAWTLLGGDGESAPASSTGDGVTASEDRPVAASWAGLI